MAKVFRERSSALRSAATFIPLAGVVCALTVLHLVWVNVDWSASYVRNASYYDLGLPDNGSWLLLFGYLGGLVLCVGYGLAVSQPARGSCRWC